MAKLLLSCDEYIYENDGQYYASSQDWFDFYERYLRVFDSLRLVCRCEIEAQLKTSRVPLARDSRIEFFPIPMFHGPKEYALRYFKVGKALRGVAENCDAAVLRIPSTVAIRVGKQICRIKLPYACEVIFDAEDGWKGSKGLVRMFWKRIDRQMKNLCARADGVSCVTESYLQKHYYPEKKTSFTSSYSSLALDKSFYDGPRLFPGSKTIIIAHTARQIEYEGRKGHAEIVHSLKILKAKGVNVAVNFAGEDYHGGIDKLKLLASELGVADRVAFPGFLSRESLDGFLRSADMFVLPTRAEGLPRVIIEAMAKGLPCITTPVSGNPELVEDHFLVPYEDVNLLAARIEELCSRADIYERTSRTNFEKSKQYEASILQSRRDVFYAELKSRVL